MKRLTTIAIVITMIMTAFPFAGGEVFAASATPQVKGVKAVAVSKSSVKVSWNKISKGITGYTVYRNGKAVKTVKKTVSTYTDASPSVGKTNAYTVKAYKNAKQKQYYNKKTKKWQTKKIKGAKTRKVTVKKYGKVSNTSSVSKNITLDLKGSGKNLILSWNAPKSGLTYTVYRNEEAIATTKGTTYTESGLSAGTYEWRISAVSSYSTFISTARNATYRANSSASGTNNANTGNSNSNTGNSNTGNSGNVGSGNNQSTGRMVKVTDFEGYTRTVEEYGSDYYNPRYNVNIDGTFTTEMYGEVNQKKGVAFFYQPVGASSPDYDWNIYLDNPGSFTVYNRGGQDGRINLVIKGNTTVIDDPVWDRSGRVDGIPHVKNASGQTFVGVKRVNNTLAFLRTPSEALRSGTVKIDVMYDFNGNGKWTSDELVKTVSKELVPSPVRQEMLAIARRAVTEYGTKSYLADMFAIEAYFYKTFEYTTSPAYNGVKGDCIGGAETLQTWSAYKYGIEGLVRDVPWGASDNHHAFLISEDNLNLPLGWGSHFLVRNIPEETFETDGHRAGVNAETEYRYISAVNNAMYFKNLNE